MAKTRKSGADVLLDVTAMMPWWLGIVLALLSYLLLHVIAAKPLVAPTQIGQFSSFTVSALWQALARIGQYVLPFIFLLGAAISAHRRREASQLHAEVIGRADVMSQFSWREFETLVGEYFRRQGYAVVQTGGGGPDGGVDVLLRKGADRYLVQCKHWRALRVGVESVRELYGVMAARRVAGGFLVTSGEFTDEARRFAEGREVQLVNGKTLATAVRAQAAGLAAAAPQSDQGSTPTCPVCRASMVVRQARSGPMAGHRFWGCSTFAQTKCRGTRELN